MFSTTWHPRCPSCQLIPNAVHLILQKSESLEQCTFLQLWWPCKASLWAPADGTALPRGHTITCLVSDNMFPQNFPNKNVGGTYPLNLFVLFNENLMLQQSICELCQGRKQSMEDSTDV